MNYEFNPVDLRNPYSPPTLTRLGFASMMAVILPLVLLLFGTVVWVLLEVIITFPWIIIAAVVAFILAWHFYEEDDA